MPDTTTHRAQITHNKAVADYLSHSADDFSDWIVTITYYTAVHAIDAVLYHLGGVNPRNHFERHRAVGRIQSLDSVYADYRELEYFSRLSRYECRRFTDVEVISLAARLDRIEQQIARLVPSP